MAMYILHTREECWWEGDSINHINPFDVREVQADGDELQIIQEQFTNTPMSKNRVVRWFGDDAKFIVANLRSDMRAVK